MDILLIGDDICHMLPAGQIAKVIDLFGLVQVLIDIIIIYYLMYYLYCDS